MMRPRHDLVDVGESDDWGGPGALGRGAIPEAPAYTTSETRSAADSCCVNKRNALLSSGNLSGESIDPETSTRNTRFDAGRALTGRQ